MSPSPPDRVHVRVRGLRASYGSTEVLTGVDLDVALGAVVALLGPSGCGKTTLLRSIAGLERPVAGTVEVDGTVLSGPETMVPPERRRIGMVFQDWALFPHMNVGANVAYGLARGHDRAEVSAALDMVGLAGFEARRPGTLSGGQQQRVALARALAPRPSVLLLDEPFSNLDSTLRAQVRTEVAELLRHLAITTVFVTHDQAEAFVLGDEVAVMAEGHIVQQAPPAELYAHPRDPDIAAFVGEANLLPGTADGRQATTRFGTVALGVAGEGPVWVLARPEEMVLGAGTDAAEAETRGVVRIVEFYGHDTVYVVEVAESNGHGEPDGPTTLRVRDASAPRWQRDDVVSVRHTSAPTVAWPR